MPAEVRTIIFLMEIEIYAGFCTPLQTMKTQEVLVNRMSVRNELLSNMETEKWAEKAGREIRRLFCPYTDR